VLLYPKDEKKEQLLPEIIPAPTKVITWACGGKFLEEKKCPRAAPPPVSPD
jgi:hypothetical protein